MATTKLTQNRKVEYDDFSHTYICGDKVLMGVTTLMRKHGLSPEYGGIDPVVLACAATRGTAIHKTLEDYDNGDNVLIRDTYHEYIVEDEIAQAQQKLVLTKDELQANLDAYKKLGLNVMCSEYLISDNKTIASSIDKVIFSSEGMVDLGDVKTTSTLHIKALEWQLGIYKYLFEKQNKSVKVNKCWGIHIRNGVSKLVEITPVSADKVKALLKAEANGEKYIDVVETPDASLVLSNDDITELVKAELKISELELAVKELKKVSDALKDKIYDHMLEHNIDEMVCGNGTFKLKRPYQTSRIDSKKLKDLYPDIAGQVMTTSEVKGSVTYKTNNND